MKSIQKCALPLFVILGTTANFTAPVSAQVSSNETQVAIDRDKELIKLCNRGNQKACAEYLIIDHIPLSNQYEFLDNQHQQNEQKSAQKFFDIEIGSFLGNFVGNDDNQDGYITKSELTSFSLSSESLTFDLQDIESFSFPNTKMHANTDNVDIELKLSSQRENLKVSFSYTDKYYELGFQRSTSENFSFSSSSSTQKISGIKAIITEIKSISSSAY